MPVTVKLDLYKEHKSEYAAAKAPAIINVGPAKYLTFTGSGVPASEQFQKAIGALYGAAYTIKMTKKFAGQDYKVCHLEGQWWGTEKCADLSTLAPESWNWRLMIRVPDFITASDLKAAVRQLREKGKGDEAADVKIEALKEGRCVQMLHVGHYDKVGATIARMTQFAKQSGLACRGRHHEIYLSDPRRVPAARLRTILRHPVG